MVGKNKNEKYLGLGSRLDDDLLQMCFGYSSVVYILDNPRVHNFSSAI